MSRDIAPNSVLPLFAGTELIRRAGALTTFPIDDIIGEMPAPPLLCTIMSSGSILSAPHLSSLIDPLNTILYAVPFPTFDQPVWEPIIAALPNAPRIWKPSPGSIPLIVPFGHGFVNGGNAANRSALYVPSSANACKAALLVEGEVLVGGSGVTSQQFVAAYFGQDPTTGSDPSNGFMMDFTVSAGVLTASFAVTRPGHTTLTGSWALPSYVPNSALTMAVDFTPGATGSTQVRFDYQHAPVSTQTVALCPVLTGAMSTRVTNWNLGADTTPAQVGLRSINTSIGVP